MATQHNNSIARTFAILGLFSEARPELTAADVAKQLGLHPVTAHRFLRSLEAVGALVTVSRGSYRLGHLFADLGNQVVHNRYLAEAAQPILEKCVEELNEGAMATVFEGNRVICIGCSFPTRQLSVRAWTGMRMEAHCTSQGKIWLAHLDPPALNRFFDCASLERLTERTITGREDLLMELERVRCQGYAVNNEERETGLRTIAAPVIGKSGRMVLGLSIFGPTPRMTLSVMEKAKQTILDAAREVEAKLYGSGRIDQAGTG